MQTPVALDFHNLEPTLELRTALEKHVAQLEDRYGKVTSGRIVVKAPSERHKSGGLYEINIRLTLPDNREVNIARTPGADERHADLNFALNDAFKRARRQLQDQVDRMSGNVKTHER
jgi:ribosome-associated translation inhibitor RaiA